MSLKDPCHIPARFVGETRKPSHRVTVETIVSVTIDWPEGIPFDTDVCKEIACGAAAQRWDRNVGPTGKIVWARCYSESSEDDADIVEIIEIEQKE